MSGAAQIILRDLDDGRIEVAVIQSPHARMSAAIARRLLVSLSEVADVRGLADQLASGARMATDTLFILHVNEAVTLDQSLDLERISSQSKGSA